MNTHMRTTGASFVAQPGKHNPRDLIIRLVEDHPTETRDDLFLKFRALIDGDSDYQRAVDWYFFVNMHDYLTSNRNRNKPASAGQREAMTLKKVNDIKRRIVDVVLLDLILPNGKALRDATFGDCAKAGGWFQLLSRKGKPSEVVGKRLSEADLKKIKFT